jgi:tRNA 2-thiouridine synthesizing protein A
MTAQILDLKGLKCPLPALKARKALKSVVAGGTLQVICTDPMAAIDIPNLIRETGDTLVSQAADNSVMVFVIRKAG